MPSEILMYIFRWVVSSDLDMRALEQLSLVCRGFYICARSAAPVLYDSTGPSLNKYALRARCCVQWSHSSFHLRRDPELWHSACVRVWGRNCTNFVPFKSWRDMFLRRPRVRFDGKQIVYEGIKTQFKYFSKLQSPILELNELSLRDFSQFAAR